VKKIVRVIAAAGAVVMFAAVVMPLASYAATDTTSTDVEVVIETECVIGSTSGSGNGGADTLSLNLTTTTPNKAVSSASGEYLGIVCNNDTWTLTEEIDTTSGATVNLVGNVSSAIGFTSWTAGTASNASDFTVNTWGMKYAEVAAKGSNSVATGAQAFHSVTTTPKVVANGVAVSGYNIEQTFGAKTDGSLAEDTYESTILYTLTGV